MQQQLINSVNLEGRNVVIEALNRGREIFEIYLDKNAKGEKIQDLISQAKKHGVKLTPVERTALDKMSKTDSHQGVIALAEKLKTYTITEILKEVENPFIFIVKEVLYEHNLGAILRSAAAAGADAVVVSGSRNSVLTPVVERVSMGASNVVKVCEESITSVLATIKRQGIKIVGVETSGTKYYFEEDLTGPIALVLGGEDSALSLPVIEKCDIVVRVPMNKNIQSLNLSVAAGIVMFEKLSQDFKKSLWK